MPRDSALWTGGFLVLIFAMLWVPMGQHAFLLVHWMKVGTFLAPFLLFVAARFHGGSASAWGRDIGLLSVLMLVAYIAHQFEEHWIDLYGQEYAFHGTVNGLLHDLFGADEALTPAGIFVINTSLVWLVGALAMWRSPRQVFPALAMASIIVVNAVSHIGVGLFKLSYNAGLLTSVAVFLPLGLYVYAAVLRQGQAQVPQVVASVVWGVLAHVIMVGGLVLGNVYGMFSETVYFAALVIWSVVPLAVPNLHPQG